MKLLDRYIALSVLQSMFTVIFVLLAILTFAEFVDELAKTGRGAYDVLQAAIYVFFSVPRLLYEIFPPASLLGTLMGLGTLAGSSELTAFRAAGVSINRMVVSVLKVALIVMAAVIVIGEFIAPPAETFAETKRSLAFTEGKVLETKKGFWVREGNHFIQMNKMIPGIGAGDIQIYTLDENQQLVMRMQAESAKYLQKNAWLLEQVVQENVSLEGVVFSPYEKLPWQSLLEPEILQTVVINPQTMSLTTLYTYSQFLQANDIESRAFVQAFWTKIMAPISVVTMVLLAVPFIFGPLRSVSSGHRIMIGTLVGIGFYILGQVVNYIGLVYEFNPLLTAVTPTLFFFGVALMMLRRIH